MVGDNPPQKQPSGSDPTPASQGAKEPKVLKVFGISIPMSVVPKLLAGVAVVLGIGAIVACFFVVHVCNDQLTTAGQTVEVCRHLTVTDPPIVAIGLVILVALGAFFSEISGFGFSLKRDVETAKDTASRAEDSASRAQDSAGEATAAARGAEVTAQAAQAIVDGRPERSLAGSQGLDQEISSLAAEYDELRARPGGHSSERTSLMTSIVNRMISLLSSAAEAIFDVSAHLESASAGLRLAGYAYLYANPDRSHSEEIIDSLLKEEKPFSQYWALRALRRQVEAALPAALDLGTRSRLEELMPSFPPGTDRARELRAILGDRLG